MASISQSSACLCLTSAAPKGVHQHCPAILCLLSFLSPSPLSSKSVTMAYAVSPCNLSSFQLYWPSDDLHQSTKASHWDMKPTCFSVVKTWNLPASSCFSVVKTWNLPAPSCFSDSANPFSILVIFPFYICVQEIFLLDVDPLNLPSFILNYFWSLWKSAIIFPKSLFSASYVINKLIY